jgi:hypothetical protein
LFIRLPTYGRFLSINKASTAPTITITIIIAIDIGRKYRLAVEVGVAVGAGVAEDAACTIMLVSAFDP